tara:strand:- start:300 stop:797 length:498 start_codon:yes stop_codon:yes gene_type:complete
MRKTSNRDSATFVENQTPFKANNLSGDFENGSYVVRSYKHYPIFICKGGQWYENNNRYSMSTAKQMTQCSYYIRENAIKKSTEELRAIINDGKEDSSLKFMKAFLKLGEITSDKNESLADRVKYKEKIVFATMRANIPQWETPRDWNTISNEDKLKRLTKLEKVI